MGQRSSAAVRYLLAIYRLSEGGRPVRSVDIAGKLAVSPASVAHMLGVLAGEGLIAKRHYGRVLLTGRGVRLASRLYTSWVLMECFFSQHLGVCQQTARADAEACLCALSRETMDRLEALVLEGDAAVV